MELATGLCYPSARWQLPVLIFWQRDGRCIRFTLGRFGRNNVKIHAILSSLHRSQFGLSPGLTGVVGATPFIALKSHSSGGAGGTFTKMYHYFQFRQTEFLQHYHKRSNVEFTFSIMKRKFGDSLRSKTDMAMTNETLCRILCHNLIVLIHEMHELGIDLAFCQNAA
jgi:hypothetical protein